MTTLADDADSIYQAVRTLNHRTISVRSIPAPEVYTVLSGLYPAAHGAVQLCDQLATGLGRSLGTHKVYEAHGGNPADNVELAQASFAVAAEHFRAAAEALNRAWSAVSGQGYTND